MTPAEAQHLDRDLAADAHRVELMGAPGSLAWPDRCPNCGEPASERVLVRKIFRRYNRGHSRGWNYVIRGMEIPLCGTCAAAHRTEARPPSALSVLLDCVGSPLMIPVVGGTVFAVITFRAGALDGLGEPYGWIGLALFGFFLFAAVWSAAAAWWSTRFLRVPAQTEIARSCDFSDNLGNVLVGERHVYALRDAAFAESLSSANADRIFSDAHRRRVKRLQTVYSVIFLAVLAAAAVLLAGR